MERETVETRGDYRAVIVRDEYAGEPDGDFQAAVISFDGSHWDTYVKCQTDAAQTFEDAAKRFVQTFGMSDGIDILERYARIFHGTKDFRVFGYSYSRDNVAYVAFDSAEMRAEWGCADDYAEAAKGTAEEWQAYLDGDVYGIAVEQRAIVLETVIPTEGETRSSSHESWETVDDTEVWGYYGEEYARAEAVAALDDYAPKND